MKRITTLLILLLAVPLGATAWLTAQDRPDDLQQRIRSTVREMGEVQSGSSVEIRVEAPGETTILEVVPEGTAVKEGDLVARLDSSAIRQQVEAQKVAVEVSQAEVARAQAQVERLQRQLEFLKQLAATEAKVLELQRNSLLGENGQLPLEKAEAEAEQRVADQHAEVLRAELEAWRKDNPEAPAPAGLDAKLTEVRMKRDVAVRRAQHVTQALIPAEQAAHELARMRAEMETQQQTSDLQAALLAATAELKAAEQTTELQTQKLAQMLKDVESCEIRAPQAGIVLHANQLSSRGAGGFVVEPGAKVRQRQTLLRIPDLARLQVRALVSETHVPRVRVGQPATVRIDALPGQPVEGVVAQISRTPEPSTFLSGDVKQYAVTVDLKDAPSFLRLGMTALVEISTQRQ